MEGEFSVYQWFVNGSREDVLRFVDAVTAVNCARSLAKSVGGRIGTTQRVIITDGLDYCVFEWKFGEGLVWPEGVTL